MTKHNRNKDLNNIHTYKALVPYGFNLSSTVGYPRFTALERKLIRIPNNFLPVFIGIILSDANISRSHKGDARLQLNILDIFILFFQIKSLLFERSLHN
jgi:hypothetical protein